jgi:ferredoxin
MSIKINFLPDDVTIDAEAGESMLAVAERAGVYIPTGCLMGSCHACEVELDDGLSVCACISSIPRGKQELTIELYSDPAW